MKDAAQWAEKIGRGAGSGQDWLTEATAQLILDIATLYQGSREPAFNNIAVQLSSYQFLLRAELPPRKGGWSRMANVCNTNCLDRLVAMASKDKKSNSPFVVIRKEIFKSKAWLSLGGIAPQLYMLFLLRSGWRKLDERERAVGVVPMRRKLIFPYREAEEKFGIKQTQIYQSNRCARRLSENWMVLTFSTNSQHHTKKDWQPINWICMDHTWIITNRIIICPFRSRKILLEFQSESTISFERVRYAAEGSRVLHFRWYFSANRHSSIGEEL